VLVSVLTAIVILLLSAVPASADPGPPDPGGVDVDGPAILDSAVASSPPTSSSTEGVTLTISARDENQAPVAPLTTAISTREYVVGGVFSGSVEGSDAPPEGVFEVGYQIGCGIDMATGGGVLLGVSGQTALGSDALLGGVSGFILPPIGIIGAGAGVTGQVGVNLKPGIVNTVPVTKKAYKGPAPEVEISNFRVKIDGCVGESFIRSYATLANSTAEVEDIVSWFGVTKSV
jgi:hypothetical protein